jgi:hypothetical protein
MGKIVKIKILIIFIKSTKTRNFSCVKIIFYIFLWIGKKCFNNFI